MIYPTREEDGSLTRILHSLKPHETPMHVRQYIHICCLIAVDSFV